MKRLAAFGIASTTVSGTVSAERGAKERTIPVGLAKKAAIQKRDQMAHRTTFKSWQEGTIADPTVYYMRSSENQYVKSAYVFPIRQGKQNDGYITVAAQRDWDPILEFSKGNPPHADLQTAKRRAKNQGVTPKSRLLYHGGMSYGIELESGKAMRLNVPRTGNIPGDFQPSSLKLRKEIANEQWERKEQIETSTDSVSTQDRDGGDTTADTVTGVPAWTSSDSSGSSSSYPYYLGTDPDPWDDWDGCTPIAASMVLCYHEGTSESNSEEREQFIDDLHYQMGTSDSGWTYWHDIDAGIQNCTIGDNYYLSSTNFTFEKSNGESEISNENRPFMLSMDNGGDDGSQSDDPDEGDYGDHSVCVRGWDDDSDGFYWEIHNGWDNSVHWFKHGNWSNVAATYVKVQ